MPKKLLIITQTVDKNDSNLGFFCEWLEEFARQIDHLYVIANKVGEYDLPKNVTVMSLGKEKGAGQLIRLFNFWKYLFKFLPQSDGVFVHMCPEYVIYGGFVARFFGKKIGLWYLHKSLNWKLRLSSVLVNNIFTAHQDGLPIKSDKVIVTGHGISLNLFNFSKKEENKDSLQLLTVGRISESKNLFFLVKFAIILQQKLSKTVKFVVVGEPYLEEDKAYLVKIKQYLKEQKTEDVVSFVGKVEHAGIVRYFTQADIFLSAGRTGGLDKAVLEPMAAELPVITSNAAFRHVLPANCFFTEGNMEELIEKVLNYKNIDTKKLRKIVEENHNLKNTVQKILAKII